MRIQAARLRRLAPLVLVLVLVLAACSGDLAPMPVDSRLLSDAPGLDGISPTADTRPPPLFTPGHIFVAGSRNAEIFEYDSTFKLITRWTHPKFGQVLAAPGQDPPVGPRGMVFDRRGRLVVATLTDFCVFSGPSADKLVQCYPKIHPEPTENVIFDLEENLYTTTSTGGTNQVAKYDSSYAWVKTFSLPTAQLTGITCDPDGNLFVASQDAPNCHIYKVDKKTFSVLDTIDLPCGVEGLQYTKKGHILVGEFGAAKGIRRIKSTSPFTLLGTISDPGLYGPVPVTVDSEGVDGEGRIYAADFENGVGTKPADLFLFSPDGKKIASLEPSTIYGPFGMVVAGAKLPCGAYQID